MLVKEVYLKVEYFCGAYLFSSMDAPAVNTANTNYESGLVQMKDLVKTYFDANGEIYSDIIWCVVDG